MREREILPCWWRCLRWRVERRQGKRVRSVHSRQWSEVRGTLERRSAGRLRSGTDDSKNIIYDTANQTPKRLYFTLFFFLIWMNEPFFFVLPLNRILIIFSLIQGNLVRRIVLLRLLQGGKEARRGHLHLAGWQSLYW